MIENRSVPAGAVLPHAMYQDLARAVAWLGKFFVFRLHYRYGDPISGAQMYLGKAWIMTQPGIWTDITGFSRGTQRTSALMSGEQRLTEERPDLRSCGVRPKTTATVLNGEPVV